ncbi:hypothetical protein BJ166DRAFT_495012 [Pestalotiopsis sp. NC0098]|nr:hypothetical protein BJ166DRAFT_495012 [Pestalotiopsis sp. NC0098]
MRYDFGVTSIAVAIGVWSCSSASAAPRGPPPASASSGAAARAQRPFVGGGIGLFPTRAEPVLVWILSFGACSRVSQVEVEPEAVAESEAGPAVEVPVGAEARAHVLGRRPCRWAARNEVVDPMARRPSSKFGTCS